MTWVVLVLVLVPDPAWRCVSIREGGEWGWHSPDVGVAEWGTVVAEQRGGVVVVVVGKEQPTMGCVEPHAGKHLVT
jgi:hypothetical protein